MAVAMELPFLLVGAVTTGAFFGWLLDDWLRTQPWFLLLFGLLGLFAGVREMLHRLFPKKPESK
jgi:F0F1-type ATP synthase assembly protein I